MIGNIAQFWRLTRELDVRGLREAFERAVSLRVLGSDLATARRVAQLIDPEPAAESIGVGQLGEDGTGRADVYVIAIGGPIDGSARRAVADLGTRGTPIVLVQLDGAPDVLVVGVPEERIVTLEPGWDDATARDRLLAALVHAAPEAMLPLGRNHVLVREAVAHHLVLDTARVNAQFAALSSLPANIPLLGGLVGDMADVLVLTKNQVLLVLKLAGLYGRDLALGRQLLLEILPIVGGAFFWRTTARMLVGLLPSLLGLVPKTLVAYAGTYVVGELARYYYRYGRRPPAHLAAELTAEARRLWRRP
jgi:uncharacterized protein (DUF697 family)